MKLNDCLRKKILFSSFFLISNVISQCWLLDEISNKMKILINLIVLLSTITASISARLKCRFEDSEYDKYACVFDNLISDAETAFEIDTTEHVPPKINSEVEQNIIESTKLSRIIIFNEIFKTFPNLDSLQQRDNDLREWKRDFLKGASKLLWLQMWDNPIENFEDDAFAEIPHLEVLWIVNSKITAINSNMFQYFSKLNSLNLSYNDFSSNLNASTFDRVAKTIVYLNMSNTKMTKLPLGIFKKFGQLQELSIEGNDLSPIDVVEIFPDHLDKVTIGEIF